MRKRGKWPLLSRPILVCLVGLLLGVGFTLLIRSLKNAQRYQTPRKCVLSEALTKPKEPQPLLVGVMTAAKYMDTRAREVWKTWAKTIPGKVLFFASENAVIQHKDMPIIRLKGVNDDYPPQKKSFAMLRWFYDNQLEKYHWFLRADDDLYVRGDKLSNFLRSLDPNKAHLIGQAGLGNTLEYGQLSLGPQDNYCMGGPGVVLSREALRSVAPHLEGCLAHLLTTHEDVEVGRCLRKHVGLACTWNYEMQTLFHNNQTVPNAYDNGNLAELRHAITLHPIKNPLVMKKVHVQALSLRLNELRTKRMMLQRDSKKSPQPSLTRRFTNTTTDAQNWNYMSGHITFCANQVNCPRHTTDVNIRAAMNEIITQLFDEFNSNARQRGRILQFQNIQYAYSRVEPRHGVDYVLDMILWFKKFRPPHRATLSVRRHAYVQQTFGPIESLTEKKYREKSAKRNRISENGVTAVDSTIYLIVPLKGRPGTFQRFSDNLLASIPPQENKIEIVLVFYKSENETDDGAIKNSIASLSRLIPVHVIDMADKSFNRGQALSAGAAILQPNALLFFIDVDMVFQYDALQRIRLNTIFGVQAYFPIVFSEFSHHTWLPLDRDEQRHFSYNRRRGYFRHFGFGIASIYKRDFDMVGGFNQSIIGWGMEDVDLFEKCINSHLRVLRAPDQIVHVYHSIKCPSTMPAKQRNMCIGSKTASLASLDSLAEQISLYA